MKAAHGLVIGKFYPPHAGHHHLVREAARRCERLTVVVMAASIESLPLERRVAWMREVHAADANVTVTGIVDDNPVDLESDAVWRAHVDLMRVAAAGVTSEPVDAVFTSEAYGDELGRRLGARHVAIDPPRDAFRVSGTAVRADPIANWAMLAPPVRAAFVLRVVLVGAESTGKTTLAAELAERLRHRGGPLASTEWIREIGRDVTAEKIARADRPYMAAITWETRDFVDIARAQAELEEAAARRAGPVLVCDTDAFATSIWHERYMGARSAEVDALGVAAPFHLYLLTHHDDVPFVDDGLRDGEHLRAWMTGAFEARLTEERRRFAFVRGPRAERLARAEALTLDALARGLVLAAPLG